MRDVIYECSLKCDVMYYFKVVFITEKCRQIRLAFINYSVYAVLFNLTTAKHSTLDVGCFTDRTQIN